MFSLATNSPYKFSLFLGYALSKAKLDATTRDIAKGSNTNIITSNSMFIILSIGIPVSPDRYCRGPNSPATSLLLESSSTSNWNFCKLSAATIRLAWTNLRLFSSTPILFCEILSSEVEIVVLTPPTTEVSRTWIDRDLALERVLILLLILSSSVSYLVTSDW